MREDIVAAVLTLFLACIWIYILNGQLFIELFLTELTLGCLTTLKVNYGGHFDAVIGHLGGFRLEAVCYIKGLTTLIILKFRFD